MGKKWVYVLRNTDNEYNDIYIGETIRLFRRFNEHLEREKEYCVKHNYSGITYQDNIYQVRNGSNLTYFDTMELLYTWVYI